jgi:hypothetical protein
MEEPAASALPLRGGEIAIMRGKKIQNVAGAWHGMEEPAASALPLRKTMVPAASALPLRKTHAVRENHGTGA